MLCIAEFDVCSGYVMHVRLLADFTEAETESPGTASPANCSEPSGFTVKLADNFHNVAYFVLVCLVGWLVF